MVTLCRFLFLLFIKCLSRLFFSFELRWVSGTEPYQAFEKIRLGMLLNHTSLYEPLILGAFPNSYLWDISKRGLVPGATKTLRRPLVGTFFKFIVPEMVEITRQRDDSWVGFLNHIKPSSMVLIAPEGRMKRASGLDSEGKPMTVRGGVADIMAMLKKGKMAIVYMEGLHHIQVPGQKFPRPFRKVRARAEIIDIETYLQDLGEFDDPRAYKSTVINDLEARRDRYCQWDD